MSEVQRKAFWFVAPLIAAVLLLLAAQKAYLPAGGALPRAGAALTCPFALATGHPCPLCGLTTSMALALRGHVAIAFQSHPLGPVLVGVAVLLLVARGRLFLRPSRVRAMASHPSGQSGKGNPPPAGKCVFTLQAILARRYFHAYSRTEIWRAHSSGPTPFWPG
ncbi:MAG: DUF2752 domain-containing protein [candidate division WS1 bacterium]|nr:DUF2752 domain-containing protein [candidate division WS1 bacterium]